MKVAVIGSRKIELDFALLAQHLPPECSEIVSGGAAGVDRCAAAFARAHNIRLTEFLPEYNKYGHGAPFIRNRQIVAYADTVLAFWNGRSSGTRSVIQYCAKIGKACTVVSVFSSTQNISQTKK